MTMAEMAEVEKGVNTLIAEHGSEGAKVIIICLVRAMKSRDAFARVGAGAYGPALIRMLIAAIRREDEEDQRNG